MDCQVCCEMLRLVIIFVLVLWPKLYPDFLPEIPRLVDSFTLATRCYPNTLSTLNIFCQTAAIILSCTYNAMQPCPISADQMRRLFVGPTDLEPQHLRDGLQASSAYVETHTEPMEDWKIRLIRALRQMMFVSGETAEASAETTAMIEEIVHTQVIEMVGVQFEIRSSIVSCLTKDLYS